MSTRQKVCLVFVFMFVSSGGAVVVNVTNSAQLATAVSNLSPGDTVVLADGIYAHNGLTVSEVNSVSNNPTIIKAQNVGGVQWKGALQIYNSSYVVVEGIIFNQAINAHSIQNVHFKNNQHCRLTRCIFDFDETGLIKSDVRYWLFLEAGKCNEIDHCQFNDKITKHAPFKLRHDEYQPKIHHNFFNQHTHAGSNGYETLQLGSGTKGHRGETMQAKVEYNLFEACDGEAEIISVKTSGNSFRFNTFRECAGQLVLRQANDCEISDNYFLNSSLKAGVGGIRIHGNRNVIRNNYFKYLTATAIETFFGDADTTLGVEAGYPQAKEIVIASNMMVDCRAAVLDFQVTSEKYPLPPKDWRITDNLFIIRNTVLIKGSGDINSFYENNVVDGIGISGITDMGRTLNSNQMKVIDNYFECIELQQITDKASGHVFPSSSFRLPKNVVPQLPCKNPDICNKYSPIDIGERPLTPADVGPYAH